MMKRLYMLIEDGGDGSYGIVYTMNGDWIEKCEELYSAGELCGPDDPGCDGDGFHYDVILVPEDATYESLGISEYAIVDEGEDEGEDEE